MQNQYIIYQISVKGIPVYIGRTNSLDRREAEHRKDYSKGKAKQLYTFLRSINFNASDIVLEPVDTATSVVDAKRREIFYMLLYTLFKGIKLYQKIPNIKDGF